MEANVRPLRADAARNRARVLDAARTAFAQAGLDVGVEEIARRAGVGKGTLYRRFPTKEALVRAIFEDILEEIDRIVAGAEAEADAWTAFTTLHGRDCARLQASNQGFYDVVAQRLGAAALTDEQRRRVNGSTARMLKRAQDAGVVRGDLVPEDVSADAADGRRDDPPGARRQPDGRALAALPRAPAGRAPARGGDARSPPSPGA